MYTIGKVAKRFGLSRSTLLYYDSIGLLEPSGRTETNYRLYTEKDINRMEKICLYREAGLPLESINQVLAMDSAGIVSLLEQKLFQINDDINVLRDQQKAILRILENKEAIKHARLLTKERWVALLEATGLEEEDMRQWHIQFEKMSPEAHQDFLESLGIPDQEVIEIRQRSRDGFVSS